MSPQFVQPKPSPAADDAPDAKPSWLVQVGHQQHCLTLPPCCPVGRHCDVINSSALVHPCPDAMPLLPQAGGAAFALTLLAIFVVSSVAGGGGPSPASGGGAAPELSEQQRQELQGQAQRFEEQLAASPDSVEALEVVHLAACMLLLLSCAQSRSFHVAPRPITRCDNASRAVQGAAATAAKLGDLKKATPLLQRLTQAKGQDPEVRAAQYSHDDPESMMHPGNIPRC